MGYVQRNLPILQNRGRPGPPQVAQGGLAWHRFPSAALRSVDSRAKADKVSQSSVRMCIQLLPPGSQAVRAEATSLDQERHPTRPTVTTRLCGCDHPLVCVVYM